MSKARRLLLLLAVLTLGCLATLPSVAEGKVVWLCRPGAQDNPCAPSMSTTLLSPSGQRIGNEDSGREGDRAVDCFYVYPTTSDQPTPQATQSVDDELRSIALYQAARFGLECRVWAPVYRQITIQGLLSPDTVTDAMRETGYQDVLEAWSYYLRKYNKGRGVVLIGHSQGTRVLRRLITEEIDPDASVRGRLVSALLLGGNVLVKEGRDNRGDFRNVRACRSNEQIGCVVAFSTFNDEVPANSRFGRTSAKRREVLCTNPAALDGGSGKLDAIFPTEPFAPKTVIGQLTTLIGFTVPDVSTEWIGVPNAYKARCATEGGTNVLQVKSRAGAPRLAALPDATWGLHLADVNIGLGNLVDLVRRQTGTYLGGSGLRR